MIEGVTRAVPPSPARSRAALRAVLGSVGALAAGTGAAVAVRGPSAIPGGAPTGASNDSVLRFYGVWWAAQGPVFWRLARDLDADPRAFDAACATIFAGGLARLLAARASGRPHPLFQALTVAELTGPPLLALWHRRVARPAEGRDAG
jgi:Domain of unknown function (DUF4345)